MVRGLALRGVAACFPPSCAHAAATSADDGRRRFMPGAAAPRVLRLFDRAFAAAESGAVAAIAGLVVEVCEGLRGIVGMIGIELCPFVCFY